jgi:hypothetical protein
MKTCSKCHATKPPEEFYSHPTTSDRLSGWCRKCTCAERKRAQLADPEGHRARAKAWYWANRERAIARTTRSRRKWTAEQKARHREVNFASHLRRKYGVTREWWETQQAAQNGRCALCGEVPTIRIPGTKRTKASPWVVDHNHATGAVRELLCTRCNTLVGFIETAPHLTESALQYLRRHAPQAT